VAADKRAPEPLVALTRAYLCGGEGRAAEIVLRASPRAGKARNASVHAQKNDVSVRFFINEACVRSITFRMAKAGWRTHAVGEACD
jgi:hypothetical protein